MKNTNLKIFLIGSIFLLSSNILYGFSMNFGPAKAIRTKAKELKEDFDQQGGYKELPSSLGGTYSEKVKLSAKNSPYTLNGDVTIDGYECKIEPGVIVKGNSGYSFKVAGGGELIAEGEKDNIIKFTSTSWWPVKGDWEGIKLTDTGTGQGSSLKYVTVEYATNGIYIDKNNDSSLSSVTIEDCTVENNSFGIYSYGQYAAPRINYSRITNNDTGIFQDRGTMDIDNSVIISNIDDGIYIYNSYEDNSVTINNSSIYGNNTGFSGAYDLYNLSSYSIDAVGNWWNTTNSATIDSNIYDSSDDISVGYVDYSGYLNSAPGGIGPR